MLLRLCVKLVLEGCQGKVLQSSCCGNESSIAHFARFLENGSMLTNQVNAETRWPILFARRDLLVSTC